MLVLAIRALDDIDEGEVQKNLVAANGRLRLVVQVGSLCRGFATDVAGARLAVWYIAEMLARHGNNVEIKEDDYDDGGDAEVTFDVNVTDISSLVPKLCWMAPAFDPETEDDGTAWFDFACEMQGWLEDRGDTPTQFPKLKSDYEADAAIARAHAENDSCDDEFAEDSPADS